MRETSENPFMEATLDKVVVNITSRRFVLLSNQGDVKVVECESPEQFEDILKVVREQCNDEVVYEY